jgi:hypothetical protein
MVAYSFKRRFVAPIARGLGVAYPVEFIETLDDRPKRQTIRAGRDRHVRPGEEIQLYHGMRTKYCFLIGRATCLDVQAISIHFRDRRSDWVRFAKHGKVDHPRALDRFARLDGFRNWRELRAFWREEHAGVDDFQGALITWQPIDGYVGEPSRPKRARR